MAFDETARVLNRTNASWPEWVYGCPVRTAATGDYKTQQGLPQVLSRDETVGFQDIGNASVETFNHAVGLWPFWTSETMLNVQGETELIEFVRATGGSGMGAEQPIGELFAIVGEDAGDLDRAGFV